MIKAVLVDDEPLARSMVAEYLEGYPQVEVVAECNDGFEGAKAIMQYQPDIVFLDIQMKTISRSEEHTSELQSRENLVCRLLLEKKKKNQDDTETNSNTKLRNTYLPKE